MAEDNSAAWAAASSLANTAAQGYAQNRLNKQTIKYNNMVYDRQRKDALTDYEAMNKYNSPEQQMRRLKEAGLNPHLIYGGGGATQTSAPIRSSESLGYQPKGVDLSQVFSGPVNAYLETRQMNTQKKLLNANILKTLTEIDSKKLSQENQKTLNAYQGSLLAENLKGMQIKNMVTFDENLRAWNQDSRNMGEFLMKIAQNTADLNKKEAETGNIKQATSESEERVRQMIKDGKIKDFEIQLNKLGFTKSDPVYMRLGKTIIDSIGLSKEEIISKIKEAAGDVGESALKAITNAALGLFGLGY